MADLMEDKLYSFADEVRSECINYSPGMLVDMLCTSIGLNRSDYDSYHTELPAIANAIANELVDRRKDCEAARGDAESKQTDESEEIESLRGLLLNILFTIAAGADSDDGLTAGMCGYMVNFIHYWICEHEAGNDEC